MTGPASFAFETGRLRSDGERLAQSLIKGSAGAISTATKGLERQLEAETQQRVPGRLWRAWGSRFYTNRQTDAAGIVFVGGGDRTRGAMTFWAEQGTARSRSGRYMAVPLPAAGSPPRGARGTQSQLTPEAWEARTGLQLRLVKRPGRMPILVADEARLTAAGRARQGRGRQAGPAAKGAATVPIFVLIPMIRFRGSLPVRQIVEAAENDLRREIAGA